MMDSPVKRALISVSDKQNIVEFAQKLHSLNIEIISTGGTASLLRAKNIPVKEVAELTDFPEIMDGRVKTLHPKIHGAILGKRQEHADVAAFHQIFWIDLVIVNLYPFGDVIQKEAINFEKAIENIDIGGPAMIRSAAKNMAYVTVVVDPADYDYVLGELEKNQQLSLAQRRTLAQKAFAHTANYDALIQRYLARMNGEEETFPSRLQWSLNKIRALRYGENPHQKACVYEVNQESSDLLEAHQHQGKELSYNNLVDAHAAISLAREFTDPACVIVKHANPCGVASAPFIAKAFDKALAADAASAFGGIVALNETCDEETAEKITATFFEVVIASGYSQSALKILAAKTNLRVLEYSFKNTPKYNYHYLDGLLLAQEADKQEITSESLNIVTSQLPSSEDIEQLLFAWRVVKQVKSNAIVIAKDHQTIGIGPGQVSRVDAVEVAIRKAGVEAFQAVLASDAFFPFKDSIEHIAQAGVRAIIQPGGSIRDEEVINACNDHGISMVFTGVRGFNH